MFLKYFACWENLYIRKKRWAPCLRFPESDSGTLHASSSISLSQHLLPFISWITLFSLPVVGIVIPGARYLEEQKPEALQPIYWDKSKEWGEGRKVRVEMGREGKGRQDPQGYWMPSAPSDNPSLSSWTFFNLSCPKMTTIVLELSRLASDVFWFWKHIENSLSSYLKYQHHLLHPKTYY